MYKCSDCGKEFKEKPQFCDCGNIYFTEIPDKTLPKQQKTKNTQKEILSWTIFALCIILSVLSLIFVGSGTNDNEKEQIQTKLKEQTTNIPDINKLWVDKKVQPAVENTKKEINVTKKQDSNTQQKAQTKTIKPQNEKKQTPQIVQKSIKQTLKPTTNKVASEKTSTNEKVQNNNITKNKPITQTKTETPPIKNTTSALNIQNTIINDIQAQTPKIDEKALQQELKQYKKDLRNRIAADINFLDVYGDGNCIITFKIDSTGRLIDRNFAKKSDNDSLNEVVFNAVKKNPAYKNPPKAYKNELLKLSVKIYGGRFEVDLN